MAAEPPAPAGAAAAGLLPAVVSAAVRSLTAAARSTLARCNSALPDCSPAISACARASSLRDVNQLAANAAATADTATIAVTHGHTGGAGLGGGAMGSAPWIGMVSRTSLMMRV